MIKEKLLRIIACPYCHGKLKGQGPIICPGCHRKYRSVNGKPILFSKEVLSNLSGIERASESYRDKFSSSRSFPTIKKIHSIIGPPDSNYSRKVNLNGQKIDEPLARFLKRFKKDSLILDLGSSSKKISENTINLDIDAFENVDVVGDGKHLPFIDSCFDGVIIQSVLEHIDRPEIVVQEAYRVLKRGGKIYISIPFVFVFHGSPNDFERYTLHGLRARLSDFKILDSGIISGPSSTFSQILRYYLALVFSFNNDFLFSLFLNVFGWITFPIKYLDKFMNKYKRAHLFANLIYAIGEK